MTNKQEPYTGPIEHVKPGDILSWDRYDEYREFMRTKKGVRDTKLWGLNEEWKDNGARPFQISVKKEEAAKVEPPATPNPFD